MPAYLTRRKAPIITVILAADSGEGAILPTWTAVDNENVKTSRELWTFMKEEGWNVDVSFSPMRSSLHLILTFASIIGKKLRLLVWFLDDVQSIFRIPISPDHPIEASVSRSF